MQIAMAHTSLAAVKVIAALQWMHSRASSSFLPQFLMANRIQWPVLQFLARIASLPSSTAQFSRTS